MAGKKNKKSNGLASASFLGPPALLDGEDAAAYEGLRDKFLDHVKPKDIFEEMYLRDIIDAQWETMRYRRLNVAHMNVDKHNAVRDLLVPFFGPDEAHKIYVGCEKQDPEMVGALDAVLNKLGKHPDEINARMFMRRLKDVERIDGLLMMAEARRDEALREFTLHREKFSTLRKGTTKTVEGVAYKEIGKAELVDTDRGGDEEAEAVQITRDRLE